LDEPEAVEYRDAVSDVGPVVRPGVVTDGLGE